MPKINKTILFVPLFTLFLYGCGSGGGGGGAAGSGSTAIETNGSGAFSFAITSTGSYTVPVTRKNTSYTVTPTTREITISSLEQNVGIGYYYGYPPSQNGIAVRVTNATETQLSSLYLTMTAPTES